jgi:hypothetical protein
MFIAIFHVESHVSLSVSLSPFIGLRSKTRACWELSGGGDNCLGKVLLTEHNAPLAERHRRHFVVELKPLLPFSAPFFGPVPK